MRMCLAHWSALKKAIADRGLDRFVAHDPSDVTARLSGGRESAAANFEPLMGAHNAIVANALGALGLEIMAPNEDGSDRCPICYLVATCGCGKDDCPYKNWIERAADDMFEKARELHLVGSG